MNTSPAATVASSDAFQWCYTLVLPVDGRFRNVDFDDWMFLMDDRTLHNEAVMNKWGIPLGEVILSFTKDSHGT